MAGQTSQSLLREYVKELNLIAVKRNVNQLWRSSGYVKAKALHDSLDLTEAENETIMRAHDAFIAARDGSQEQAPAGGAESKRWKMNGRGFMLTYNKKKWSHPPALLFQAFLVFLKALVATLGCSKWTATCEESMNSKDKGRVHLHAYLEWAQSVSENLDERFDFESQRPRADNNWYNIGALERLDGDQQKKFEKRAKAARGCNQRVSLDEGHFYVYMDKIGTIASEANTSPFIDYWPRLEKN